jgi:small basic protein
MNAPLRHPPPTGSPDELRDFALTCLAIAAEYVVAAEALARIGDDLGFARQTQKLVATVIAIGETAADLRRRSCTDR